MTKSTMATTVAASTTTIASNRAMTNKVLPFGVALIVLLAVNISFAAPANSNEDQIGFAPSSSSNRQTFRNRDANPALVEYNIVPIVPDTGIPLDAPVPLGVQPAQQQPIDFGIILNYLLSRHYAGANRARLIPDMDSAKNEYTRKRSSYSRYCAFNAVSCFGRKK